MMKNLTTIINLGLGILHSLETDHLPLITFDRLLYDSLVTV